MASSTNHTDLPAELRVIKLVAALGTTMAKLLGEVEMVKD